MGRFGIIFFAIFAHLAAYAAEPKKWYAPQDGWQGGNAGTATIKYFSDESGIWVDLPVEVEKDGTAPDLTTIIENLQKSGLYDIANAVVALREALQAQVMAKNTSDNLNAMFAGGVAQITDADGTSSGGSYQFTPKEGNKVELSLTGVQTVKAGGGLEKSQGKIGVSGWDSNDGNSYSIADVLSGNAEGPFANYGILARMAKGGSMDYVKIGRLASATNQPSAEADNVSIATNRSGRLEIAGFGEAAEENDIPIVQGSGDSKSIHWRTMDTDVFTVGNGGEAGYKVSLKGYSSGLGANRYLGSGEDGTWGVHELPNVTTNNVVADETTITTEGSPTPEQKVFRLKAVPPTAGLPYAATGDGNGGIAYVPLPEAATNESSECACTQKWERVTTWLGDFNLLEATPWLFGFPSSWLGYAVERSNGEGYSGQRGLLDIKGFALGNPCGKGLNLGGLLMGTATDAATERENHMILTRYYTGSGDPTVHYLPIGAIASTTRADGRSVVTNGSGVLSIAGFLDAPEEAGLMPVTTMRDMGGTTLEWVPTNTPPASAGAAIKFVGTDRTEVVVGSGSTTNTVTFASATNSLVEVSVGSDGLGNATVTIGVYYQ